ncbi:hypothetical protein BC832DRAFT_229543 [Gaertneriomyces semiglobifer]|nr:hypothetical protein BC832DRAFT_229543 [Gaertneriomyces semiglobifer]
MSLMMLVVLFVFAAFFFTPLAPLSTSSTDGTEQSQSNTNTQPTSKKSKKSIEKDTKSTPQEPSTHVAGENKTGPAVDAGSSAKKRKNKKKKSKTQTQVPVGETGPAESGATPNLQSSGPSTDLVDVSAAEAERLSDSVAIEAEFAGPSSTRESTPTPTNGDSSASASESLGSPDMDIDGDGDGSMARVLQIKPLPAMSSADVEDGWQMVSVQTKPSKCWNLLVDGRLVAFLNIRLEKQSKPVPPPSAIAAVDPSKLTKKQRENLRKAERVKAEKQAQLDAQEARLRTHRKEQENAWLKAQVEKDKQIQRERTLQQLKVGDVPSSSSTTATSATPSDSSSSWAAQGYGVWD